MIRNLLRPLLPEYANGTLPPYKKWMMDCWLRCDEVARTELQALLHLRKALQSQSIGSPSVHVWHRIKTHVQASAGVPTIPQSIFWRVWAVGMASVTLALILLWYVLPPGIVLRWTAAGETPAVFRIYRAVSGEVMNFQLIKEIDEMGYHPAVDTHIYTYRDFLLLPGREYIYRVEVVDQNGLTISQTITGNGMIVWPGQLALLLTMFVIVYGIRLAVQKPRFVPAPFG